MKGKTPIFASVLILVVASVAFGQEVIKSPLGFSIRRPNSWKVASEESLDAGKKDLNFSDADIEQLLKSKNNSILVMALQKYASDEKVGVIPTIQVRMRPNPTSDFPVFMAAFIRSVDPSRSPFENYSFTEKPREISISGMRAVQVNSTYTLRDRDGNAASVRVRTYAIPFGKQYFQTTFLDNPMEEDCSTEFDALVKSIHIGRELNKRN
jgi:hypothetical protein